MREVLHKQQHLLVPLSQRIGGRPMRSSSPGLLKLLCSAAPFQYSFFMRPHDG